MSLIISKNRKVDKLKKSAELLLKEKSFVNFVTKKDEMTTIVKVNNRSKAARLFLEYIKTLPFVEFEHESPRYNEETEKAMKEARAGKGIIKTKDHEDLMKKLRS